MQCKAQGSLEYLLLIGGAVLVAAIVIGLVVSTSGAGSQTNSENIARTLCINKSCTGTVNVSGTNYVCYGTINSCNIIGSGQTIELPIVSASSKSGACTYNSPARATRCCLHIGLPGTNPCSGFSENPVETFAYDNNPSTMYCSMTRFEGAAPVDYFTVDLAQKSEITGVTITQRTYSAGPQYACAQARNYSIQVYNENTSAWDTIKTAVGDTSLVKTYTYTTGAKPVGRQVRLYVTNVADGSNTGWRLGIYEFKVSGTPVAS